MDKKISIILVAMLCLSMFPWASIGVGSEAKDVKNVETLDVDTESIPGAGSDVRNVKNAETLKVDAWVESKLAKPGDTIEIYAKTSYTDGVSVSADIAEIYIGDFDDTQDYLIEQYVATVSLTYDATEEHWVGTYTIPSSAGGVYVADVTATDGTNTVNDNATVHLQKFYDEHLKPVRDNAGTFLYGEFNDTINDIKENLTALNDTINTYGGIRGIVENLTGLPEWQALLDASYEYDYEHYYSEYFSESFSDSTLFEYNITLPDWVDVLELNGYCYSYDWEAEVNVIITLTDPDENVYTYDLNDYEPYMISSPVPGNWTINISTTGNGYFSLSIDGYKCERSKIANFFDNLTKFILSDEYESIASMIPELKSFIFGIPEENIIDYLLGFNLTHYLEKIEGTEGIVAAYNALMSSNEYANLLGSDEYADFQNALDALQTSETYWNMENLTIAIIDLFASNEMMNLLNATAEHLHDLLNETTDYLQGNDTALQNLISSFVALDGDFNSQLETLMRLPEFGDLMGAVMNDTNLSPVFESINTTFHNITNRVMEMVNSTQLKDLQASIENLGNYIVSNVYEHEWFSENETFQYNYTVKDWMKSELYLDLDPYFDGYYDYENDIWVPGTGNITVTLTDPNGVVYTYTEAYNGSGYSYWDEGYYEYGVEEKQKPSIFGGKATHDYTILLPTSGNWTINVATFSDSGGGGNYQFQIGPNDDFMSYMIKESMEELFFVFNAGIAIETDYFQTIGTNGSAKLIAYDANGRMNDVNVTVVVSRQKQLTSDCSGGSATSFPLALQQYLLMYKETLSRIVYEGTVTTDSNGEVIINFPVEEFGIYSIDAYFEDENKIGFGSSGFIGESYVPEIGLTQIGKFAGIPVYMNPNKIGENITFNVNISDGENATVGIGPMPLDELFPDINMSYESSDTTITGPDTVSLQVNGPVSMIGVITEMPSGEVEYREYNEGYTSYPDTSFSIPQFNISFGILLTSNVSISLDTPSIARGERSQLDISASGSIGITFGVAGYANGMDIMSLDVCTLSTLLYESSKYSSTPETSDVIQMMTSFVWGFGNAAFLTIPHLASDGDYSIITVTSIDDTEFGVALTSVYVYATMDTELPVISHTPITTTVENNPITINATITDDRDATGASLFYRKIGETNYTKIQMSNPEGDFWTGNIPANMVTTVGIEYYIWATDGINNITHPSTNPETSPHAITVKDATPPLIIHTPLTTWTENTNITITATITDESIGVTFAGIFYRVAGEVNYTEISMSNPEGDFWTGNIPANMVTTIGIEYYIWATDGINNITHPSTNPETSPHAITVTSEDITPPVIIHTPITTSSKNTNITITATITDDSGVTNTSIFYRKVGDIGYTEIPMNNPEGNLWTAIIPASMVTSVGLEYYIWATDGTNNISTPAYSITVPTTTTTSVNGNEVTVDYNGTGTLTVTHVTVDEIETTPKKDLPSGKKHIGIFIDVDTTGTIHDAFITVKYDDSDVAGIDESKLMMYYWNETTSEWTLIEDSGVWTNNNTVWARVTHFTIFAPMAEKTSAGPAPGIGWLIYVGVFSAVIIIVVISLAVTVKRKKKTLPPSP